MKEVKQFSKSYILISTLYVVLGAVLLVWPTTSVKMIYYGLGFFMIVLGITYGFIYFTRESQRSFLQLDLVIGIVCLAFGVFILLNPTFLQAVLPFAMGIILLLGAVVKIQNSINMKHLRLQRWYLMLIGGLVIIALGIVLLCNIIKEERHLIIYIGICLILDGVTNLTSLICIQMRVKKLAKLQKEYPNVSVEELLAGKAEEKVVDSETVTYQPVPKSGDGSRQ